MQAYVIRYLGSEGLFSSFLRNPLITTWRRFRVGLGLQPPKCGNECRMRDWNAGPMHQHFERAKFSRGQRTPRFPISRHDVWLNRAQFLPPRIARLFQLPACENAGSLIEAAQRVAFANGRIDVIVGPSLEGRHHVVQRIIDTNDQNGKAGMETAKLFGRLQ